MNLIFLGMSSVLALTFAVRVYNGSKLFNLFYAIGWALVSISYVIEAGWFK